MSIDGYTMTMMTESKKKRCRKLLLWQWDNTMSSTPAGTTMGLKESECGQMGVTMMAGTLGWIIEAPAAAAYAVLPVGVDTMTPAGQRRGGSSNIASSYLNYLHC